MSKQLAVALALFALESGAHNRIVERLNKRRYPESGVAYDKALAAGRVVSEVVAVAVGRIKYH